MFSIPSTHLPPPVHRTGTPVPIYHFNFHDRSLSFPISLRFRYWFRPRSAQIDQALPSNMSKIEICFLFFPLFFSFFAYLDIYWKGTDKHKSEQIIILAKCQHTETKIWPEWPAAGERGKAMSWRWGVGVGAGAGAEAEADAGFGLGGTGWQRDAADDGWRTPRQSWSIGHVFIFDLCVFIFMHACESGRSQHGTENREPRTGNRDQAAGSRQTQRNWRTRIRTHSRSRRSPQPPTSRALAFAQPAHALEPCYICSYGSVCAWTAWAGGAPEPQDVRSRATFA